MGGMEPPSWVAEPLSWLGLEWPKGDPVALDIMSEEWRDYAGELWGHLWSGNQTTEELLNVNSGAIDKFGDWWSRPGGPKEFLTKANVRAENHSVGLKIAAVKKGAEQALYLAELYALVLAVAYASASVIARRVTVEAGEAATRAAIEKAAGNLGRGGKPSGGLPPIIIGPLVIAAGAAVYKLFLEPMLDDAPDGTSPTDPRNAPDGDEQPAEPQPQPAADGAAKGPPRKTDRLKEHLTERDLEAARRELKTGPFVYKPDGTPWDHVTEVRDAQRGLLNRIQQLKRRITDPRTSPAERADAEAELREASRLLDHSEGYVPRQ